MNKETLKLIDRMRTLNKRLAFVEMTDHRFLNKDFTKERTTYADGTTVTVDWIKQSVQIIPDVD